MVRQVTEHVAHMGIPGQGCKKSFFFHRSYNKNMWTSCYHPCIHCTNYADSYKNTSVSTFLFVKF
jgi:hypothetical protein